MESPKSRIGHVADELHRCYSCGMCFIFNVLVLALVVAVAVVAAAI